MSNCDILAAVVFACGGGFTALVPTVPSAIGNGATEAEAIEHVRTAIEQERESDPDGYRLEVDEQTAKLKFLSVSGLPGDAGAS
jgi:predicted RNase H-like HicB family nuclease